MIDSLYLDKTMRKLQRGADKDISLRKNHLESAFPTKLRAKVAEIIRCYEVDGQMFCKYPSLVNTGEYAQFNRAMKDVLRGLDYLFSHSYRQPEDAVHMYDAYEQLRADIATAARYVGSTSQS